MPAYSTETDRVTSVWSAHGHRFMGDGDGNTESCLRCGAMYQLLAHADDPSSGVYLTASGDEPAYCTGDTSMVHGYSGEVWCDACDNQEDGCEHCNHACPCIACDS